MRVAVEDRYLILDIGPDPSTERETSPNAGCST